MLSKDLIWHSIPLSIRELNLSKVLICGQAFRWRANAAHQISSKDSSNPTIWSSTLGSHVIFVKQTPDKLFYTSYPPNPTIHDLVTDYFQLEVKLTDLYDTWVKSDANFQSKSGMFEGVRMLRQDPFETLISFICSSNNNIKRISMMCENLCLNFGELIGKIDGVKYHSFPSVDKLQDSDLETKLRSLGFGYRANYIASTCQQIFTNKDDITALRRMGYKEAHETLLTYKGIGPKIADCICLMALDKTETIPVDTHVFQIAKRDYKLKVKGESVTKANYEIISGFFKEKWGQHAGWAQTVMFAADLKVFSKPETEPKMKIKKELEVDVKIEIKEEITKDDQSLILASALIEESVEYHNSGRPKRRKVAVKSENLC